MKALKFEKVIVFSPEEYLKKKKSNIYKIQDGDWSKRIDLHNEITAGFYLFIVGKCVTEGSELVER